VTATTSKARGALVRLAPRSPSVVRLALSVGCPSGIGPEVAVRAAATAGPRERILLVGDLANLRAAASATGVEPSRLVRIDDPALAWDMPSLSLPVLQPGPSLLKADRTPGKPTPKGGAAQLAWIDAACDLVSSGRADALVTGPANKESVASSGAPGAAEFLGHTEHLQRRLHAPEVVMAFAARELTTALVTTHLPLAKVPAAITPEAVARAAYWLVRLVAATQTAKERETGADGPRVAVASLNPHAGEGGLLGDEEGAAIVPGMNLARKRLAEDGIAGTLIGPVPAESALRRARGKDADFDAVVAMYHDQATIPMKLVGFGEAVNVTLALPIIRTSVDHGTAYDRAGQGTADPRGMREAIRFAALMARKKALGGPG
jgi:4-hydroxythreonine-4-phosphate dehydrogenase